MCGPAPCWSDAMIADFGSYYAGGMTLNVTGRDVRHVQVTDFLHLTIDENGAHAVGHAYVQFFVPQKRNAHPPIVLLHGGGMCGSVWEQTPDGRKGWLHRLLHHGYEVHIVDSVERGRAGWSPHLVSDPPLTRTLQDAWTLFRFGDADGFATRTPFANQRFPVDHLERLGQFFVPRWVSQANAQIEALAAVLRKLGRSIVMFHSQGAETAFAAAARESNSIEMMIALEPSDFPDMDSAAAQIPLVLVQGGHLHINEMWRSASQRWKALVDNLASKGTPSCLVDLNQLTPGFSHMFMHDGRSDDVLDFVLDNCGSLT